eukprot:scaffold116688_cov57-Phaeocystis_antarctica.AAC.1
MQLRHTVQQVLAEEGTDVPGQALLLRRRRLLFGAAGRNRRSRRTARRAANAAATARLGGGYEGKVLNVRLPVDQLQGDQLALAPAPTRIGSVSALVGARCARGQRQRRMARPGRACGRACGGAFGLAGKDAPLEYALDLTGHSTSQAGVHLLLREHARGTLVCRRAKERAEARPPPAELAVVSIELRKPWEGGPTQRAAPLVGERLGLVQEIRRAHDPGEVPHSLRPKVRAWRPIERDVDRGGGHPRNQQASYRPPKCVGRATAGRRSGVNLGRHWRTEDPFHLTFVVILQRNLCIS